MKVIFNSDVLFPPATGRAGEHVPRWFVEFAENARAQGCDIVIPETAYLELLRAHQARADFGRTKLGKAYKELRRHGIEHDEPDPEDVIQVPDLVSVLGSLGISIDVPSATLTDFTEAHRRACLHLAPHTSLELKDGSGHRKASDEMRDLVIWIMALRLAQEEGGAVLVSRDRIHTGPAGDEEAHGVGLVRVQDASSALEVDGPGAVLVALLLHASWSGLTKAGLPLAPKPAWAELKESIFVQGDRGPAQVKATVALTGKEGKVVRARATFFISGGLLESVKLVDVSVADEPFIPATVTVDLGVAIPQPPPESDSRLKALRRIIGLPEGDS